VDSVKLHICFQPQFVDSVVSLEPNYEMPNALFVWLELKLLAEREMGFAGEARDEAYWRLDGFEAGS